MILRSVQFVQSLQEDLRWSQLAPAVTIFAVIAYSHTS